MVLIDINSTFIANLMAQLYASPEKEISEGLVRHMVLNSIVSYRKKFVRQYGELVLCSDSRGGYWRKDIFPYYKINRKKYQEDSKFNWTLIFETMNIIKNELQSTFPYKYIEVPKAEADDVIAALCEYSQSLEDATGIFTNEAEKVLIVSPDKDYIQLQKYGNVFQFSPTKNEFIKESNPKLFLKEQIIRGDATDGVPNFLTQDDIYTIPGQRSKPIRKEKLAVWVCQEPEEFCFDERTLRNYRRNENLISFEKIPAELKTAIVESFKSAPINDRRNLYKYFVQKGLSNLLSDVGSF